jgi:hypothetical protein
MAAVLRTPQLRLHLAHNMHSKPPRSSFRSTFPRTAACVVTAVSRAIYGAAPLPTVLLVRPPTTRTTKCRVTRLRIALKCLPYCRSRSRRPSNIGIPDNNSQKRAARAIDIDCRPVGHTRARAMSRNAAYGIGTQVYSLHG